MDSEKKSYEISFLLGNENDVEAVLKHLSQIGAEILNEGKISEVSLAYPIKKLASASFGWIYFSALPEKIGELNSALKMDGKIIRYLIITPPIVKTEKKRPAKASEKEESSAPAAPVATAENELSNEELEKKLEEILQ
ncbi:MAG: 30S ribosomal protein S6 [Patescibacteria group bacterium]|nr:30S ribosomal protein S6 [Patescibacteria group bacterium]